MKSILLSIIYCFVLIADTSGQMLNGNAFIKGQFLEAGITDCGLFGATYNAPPGYHPRASTLTFSGPDARNGPNNLAFVADVGKNGWTVKGAGEVNKYNGDYFLQNKALGGWSVGYNNGQVSFNKYTFCVSNTASNPGFPSGAFTNQSLAVDEVGDRQVATWQGKINDLTVKKEVSVQDTSLYLKIKITLKNIGSVPLANVYYSDQLNPDQGFYVNDINTGDENTQNSIIFQNPANGKALVESRSNPSSNIYLGIGTRNCQARVSRFQSFNSWISSPSSAFQGINSYLITGSDNNFNNDFGIGISTYQASLAPGASINLVYTYIFKEGDITRAMNATAPGFSFNDREFNSNDTIYACPNSTVPIELTNAENYTWSWLPAAGATPAAGPNVTLNMGNGFTRYIATGVGSCGIFKDTINIMPYNINRLYVDSSVIASGNGASWAAPLKTVSEALDLANSLSCVDEIWVKKGTYFPMKNYYTVATSRDSSFRIKRSGIKLYGGFAGNETFTSQRNIAANETILSGNIGLANDSLDNVYHVMTVVNIPASADSIVVDGFTVFQGVANGAGTIITNGYALSSGSGGGINCRSVRIGNQLLIKNVKFYQNAAMDNGGGISLTGSSPLLANCLFSKNVSEKDGGALSAYTYFTIPSQPQIINSTFQFNVSNLGGAAISNLQAPAAAAFKFSGCNFISNSSLMTSLGGTILNQTSSPVIDSCTFISNYIGGLGGAIFNYTNSNPVISNCIISGNSAYLGGGITNTDHSNSKIINCLISGNIARVSGGGGIDNGIYSSPEIINCTISGNTYLAGTGGGIQNGGFCSPLVINTIIFGNITGINNKDAGSQPIIQNSLVQGLTSTANGNINGNTDPQFIAPQSYTSAPDPGGDYRVKICSPVIDKGDNTAIPVNILKDLDGNPRIQNLIVDMGAYESSFPPHSVTIAASPAFPVCVGTNVTFTATPINVGSLMPAFQWLLNGNPIVGETTATYSSSTLASGSTISVLMTPNFGCTLAADVSNVITVSFSTSQVPAVSISASATTVCIGSPVTFTASPTNGGTTPTYQWQVNGANAGTNSATFISSSLSNNDVVKVIMTSNYACVTTTTAISNTIPITINPAVTASVIIAASQINFCAGTAVTFTATPTNGGAIPSYQWQVNGVNAGTDSPIFTSTTLNNNDQVSVLLTSNEACVSPATILSNVIPVSVTAQVVPVVNIVENQNNICVGAIVIFTATPVNGGTSPTYQWKINGVNVGVNSNLFFSGSLANGDIVTVEMTSNANCATNPNVASNAIPMQVNPLLTPLVNIAASQTTFCAGSSVTFTATPTNEGTIPVFQWQVNGINAGTNSPIFTTTALNNNDAVKVLMTSNAGCLTTANASSNLINITVNPLLTAAVSVSATQTSICAGSTVTFNATPTNGGSLPSYQWQVNGANAGTNSPTFTSSTLNNNDQVTVILSSNAPCVSPLSIISNIINMTVAAPVTPTVTASANRNNICAGSPVTFTTASMNEGSSPSYQWKVNGVNAGTNSATFSSSTINNNDVVTVVVTTSLGCVTATTAVSNSVIMIVAPNLTPSVTITGSSNNICAGTTVNFTAVANNGGNNPSYQWQVNGSNVGSNSSTYSSATLSNSDIVKVIVTSNATCLTTATAGSNSLVMIVHPNLTPTATISANKPQFCENENIILTASITNGGTNPAYQWTLNGVNVGSNSPTYSSTGFHPNDTISTTLTSSETCLASNNVSSNKIVLKIFPNPILTVTADNPEILEGGTTTLRITSTVPVTTYNWQPTGSLNNSHDATPKASPPVSTIYTVDGFTSAGCKGSGAVFVKVVPGPKIANTFSPNGDGINDKWVIKNLETYPQCRVQVFARNGQLVFESKGYLTPWDGNYNGKTLPVDTYYYIIELNNRIGTKPVTGYVTVVK